MVNGLGVLGWGVGGIEAEAVKLGEPYMMKLPEVVGVKLTGRLTGSATASDLVLTLTQILRKHGVVEKFVEYHGSGYQALELPDRAVIANMGPEYGATAGFCPLDSVTVKYLEMTGRTSQAELALFLGKTLGLCYEGKDAKYDALIELDLSTVQPSLAGPKRPQDRVLLSDMKKTVAVLNQAVPAKGSSDGNIPANPVAIAAITSCTNTSNPAVMLAAGLLAKKAVERGLKVPSYVKTSLAPGSRVVEAYMKKAGLQESLDKLGFQIVAFGCTTCIGNSGPLPAAMEAAIKNDGVKAFSVSSGNRNFEARIHSLIPYNFLCGPALVVAYALAGTTDIDFASQPIGKGSDGKPVHLSDIWPTGAEIASVQAGMVSREDFVSVYKTVFDGDKAWQALPITESALFAWDLKSTYIRKPDYFITPNADGKKAFRCLLSVGDSVTTDHISPAGSIPSEYPAGQYLQGKGVAKNDFNSYGSRRGNHEVMMRGTFANIRIKNKMADGKEGSYTKKHPEGDLLYIFDASEKYAASGTPLVVLAGKEYGTGSSRDWAAKGPRLLGVEAVIAESFERIHRSNLIGMGILPLQFTAGQNADSLGLDGSEEYTLPLAKDLDAGGKAKIVAIKPDGSKMEFKVLVRLDTPWEKMCLLTGGILPFVAKKVLG
jgi:aconitate hydratase